MKSIDEVPASGLKGMRVLVRSDFNVPILKSGEVGDIFRIKQGWKTIQYLSERGAKVIVMSHLGRDPEETLAPIAKAINEFARIVFVPDITGIAAQGAASEMKEGEILLLENLRKDPRESTNDPAFAKELAGLADMFVNDAFAVAHRTHTSVVGVPALLPSYAGFLMRDEIREINLARAPLSPSFAILGGAKFETKAPLVELLLQKYDHLFLTGALANDIYKAWGFEVGRSLISKELPGVTVLTNSHLVPPIDVTVETAEKQVKVKKPHQVEKDDKIVDIGPDSLARIAPYIAEAKFILWNGPTGIYEAGYTMWTQGIAELISKSDAKKVIGGGDTIAAIEDAHIDTSHLGFLSTGGGAMLEFLLKGTLPAIEALK